MALRFLADHCEELAIPFSGPACFLDRKTFVPMF